jgi:hypothetical protein
MGFEFGGSNRLRVNSPDASPVPASYRGYRSQCKKCGFALLESQKAIWLTGPIIGLAHERCDA